MGSDKRTREVWSMTLVAEKVYFDEAQETWAGFPILAQEDLPSLSYCPDQPQFPDFTELCITS